MYAIIPLANAVSCNSWETCLIPHSLHFRAGRYLTSGGGGQAVLLAGAVASGALEAGTAAEMGAGEFS